MRLLATLTCLMIGLGLSAQVSITSTNMPSSGDTFRYVMTQPLAFQSQLQQTGANKTWNFNTTDKNLTMLDEYKSSLKTPYAFFFFNTTGKLLADTLGLAQFQLKDVYQFFKKTSTKYQVEGIGFKLSLTPLPLAGNYSEEDVLFNFPLEYGNRDSNGFSVSISIPSIGSYKQSGYRITEVVGHGTSIIVNDTFDCLMLKTTAYGYDSIQTLFASFGVPFERTEYLWMSPDFAAPLASISGNTVAGNFVPTQSRYMNFEPKAPSGGGGGGGTGWSDNPDWNPQFYPNPANDQVFLGDKVLQASVHDLSGRQLVSAKLATSMEIKSLASGVYLLRLSLADGRVQTYRLVKN